MNANEEPRPRKIIRRGPQLRELTGYGTTAIDDMVKRGEFPKPVQLGPRAVGFFEDEIIEWQNKLRRAKR